MAAEHSIMAYPWFRGTAWTALIFGLMSQGCVKTGDREVIVYTSLDREFSEPIFDQFTKETGIRVRASFDSESTKTVQHATNILAEKRRPRCDLFWNNEILNTLRIDREGLLDTYRPKVAKDYPPAYQSANGTWHGFAARARILLVNTELVSTTEIPTSIFDLVDPKWNGRVGVAKPMFGTTASHAVCLFDALGEEKAGEFFRQLAESAQIMSGNKQVAVAVSRGQLAFGLTDTDDAIVEIEKGFPVKIVYPDQDEGQLGTLFLPNTLALLKDSPNNKLARQLVDYLLSPEIEKNLANGPSAQIPLNTKVNMDLRVLGPGQGKTASTAKAMEVDFDLATEKWDKVSSLLEQLFAKVRP